VVRPLVLGRELQRGLEGERGRRGKDGPPTLAWAAPTRRRASWREGRPWCARDERPWCAHEVAVARCEEEREGEDERRARGREERAAAAPICLPRARFVPGTSRGFRRRPRRRMVKALAAGKDRARRLAGPSQVDSLLSAVLSRGSAACCVLRRVQDSGESREKRVERASRVG